MQYYTRTLETAGGEPESRWRGAGRQVICELDKDVISQTLSATRTSMSLSRSAKLIFSPWWRHNTQRLSPAFRLKATICCDELSLYIVIQNEPRVVTATTLSTANQITLFLANMHYRKFATEWCTLRACGLTGWQLFLREMTSWPPSWPLKVWRHIIFFVYLCIYLKNNPAKFHPDPISNDRDSGFF